MLEIIFVVLMVLCFVGGGYIVSRGDQPCGRYYGGGYFLLCVCVAILGWLMFGGR